MANYTDLTTLEGLQVGDVVTYTTNDTAINLAGCKVKLEVVGNAATAGYSCGTLTSDKIIYFIAGNAANTRCSAFAKLPSTEDGWLYTRFLVSGNRGEYGSSGGKGGGLTAGTGSSVSDSMGFNTASGGAGGTQTSGGAFGTGGTGNGRSGGAGWYGGKAGGYKSSGNLRGHGGGGSGYVLTNDSHKPTGYMEDWSDYVLSDTELITGGASTYYDETTLPYHGARITILEAAAGGSTSTIQYYAENEFIPCEAYYYSETGFIQCEAYYYNGTEFKILGS